jgi:hypothetical protein
LSFFPNLETYAITIGDAEASNIMGDHGMPKGKIEILDLGDEDEWLGEMVDNPGILTRAGSYVEGGPSIR